MNYAQRKRIPILRDLIPKDYIGEKFGVMLVFIKGKDQTVIDAKAKKLRELALTLAEFDRSSKHSRTDYQRQLVGSLLP